jgi:phosphomannomutase
MAELVAEDDAVAGFEGNGGFLTMGEHLWRGRFIAPLPTRDAILPLVAVLAAAREAGRTVSQLVADLPPRAKATGRLQDVDTRLSQIWIDRLVAAPSSWDLLRGTSSVQTVDGAKFMLEDGNSLHLRLSGNAPELRVYVETANPRSAEVLLQNALKKARTALM